MKYFQSNGKRHAILTALSLISHYCMCAVRTTVFTKAFHFKKISELVKIYFQRRNDAYVAEAERYLSSAVQKTAL